jgi:hypothetical protein
MRCLSRLLLRRLPFLTGVLLCVLLSLVAARAAASAAQRLGNRKYVPVYASKIKSATPLERGTLQGDFSWAAASTTLRAALARWRHFVRVYAAPDYELGDGYEARLVTIGQYELMRVFYLLGNATEGDKLFKKIDPLDLGP